MARENILFGYHAAEEALKKDVRRVNQIWTSRAHSSSRLQRLIRMAREQKIPVHIVDSKALFRLTENPRHQDIVLEVSPYKYQDADSLLETVTDESIFCILDEIQDTTNLAALIRTAEGAGVQGIFLPDRRSAAVTATTARLSAGALEHIKIGRVTNLAQWIETMQQKGIRVICADSSATKIWYEADFSGPVAILVGNEFKGVRRLLKDKSDELVRIPMLGKVASLNVNVAAAILLYEAVRQHRK